MPQLRLEVSAQAASTQGHKDDSCWLKPNKENPASALNLALRAKQKGTLCTKGQRDHSNSKNTKSALKTFHLFQSIHFPVNETKIGEDGRA